MTLLLEQPSIEGPLARRRKRLRLRTWLPIIVGLVVVMSAGFAARYQPLTMYGSWSVTTHGANGHTKTTYDSPDIKNQSLFGVTIVSIKGLQVDQYPLSSTLSATEVCPITKTSGSECSNDNPKGITVGLPFHPFALSGGRADEVLWHFSYDCRTADSALTVSVPVTYRFLLFTRTVDLSVPADESTC